MMKAHLDDLPRVSLGAFPTPLVRAARFSEELGGPEVWLKREDLSGLVFGSNKVRKFEFLVGDALKRGADVLISVGPIPVAGTVRIAAAAARRVGLKAVLVEPRQSSTYLQSNVLLAQSSGEDAALAEPEEFLGTEVRLAEPGQDLNALAQSVAEEVRRKGLVPYVVPMGGSDALGTVAYADCAREIQRQAEERGIRVDYVITASGSGGTQGGLVLGARAFQLPFAVWGVSGGKPPRDELRALVARMASDGAELLDVEPFGPDDIVVYDEYAGPQYGVPSEAGLEASRWLARCEGIMLDPIYTSKAMAALIDLTRKRVLQPGQTVVFLQSAGSPELYAYNRDFRRLLMPIDETIR